MVINGWRILMILPIVSTGEVKPERIEFAATQRATVSPVVLDVHVAAIVQDMDDLSRPEVWEGVRRFDSMEAAMQTALERSGWNVRTYED